MDIYLLSHHLAKDIYVTIFRRACHVHQKYPILKNPPPKSCYWSKQYFLDVNIMAKVKAKHTPIMHRATFRCRLSVSKDHSNEWFLQRTVPSWEWGELSSFGITGLKSSTPGQIRILAPNYLIDVYNLPTNHTLLLQCISTRNQHRGHVLLYSSLSAIDVNLHLDTPAINAKYISPLLHFQISQFYSNVWDDVANACTSVHYLKRGELIKILLAFVA